MDESGSSEEQPTGERWDPLGAANDEEEPQYVTKQPDCSCNHSVLSSVEKLKTLEEEQELLNSSLFALTTHFAQVQFRLRQISVAPPEDRDELLKSLEEFAFRGIPDITGKTAENSLTDAMRLCRAEQQNLIEKLKSQLRELEQYAFETGDAGIPQEVMLERQRVILNELKLKMNLQLDEQKFYQLTPADVKQQVDLALGQLVNPLRMKEHLVAQLKTQVADLERFIDYLQADTNKHARCVCGCALHSLRKPSRRETAGIVQRAAVILQMLAMMNLGCGLPHFKRNDLKRTMKGNHWGDLRARLEVDIARVKELLSERDNDDHGEYSSDAESPVVVRSVKVTTAVRKYLATSIRDLIQHGAVQAGQTRSLVPFVGCFARRQSYGDERMHAWELILGYYRLKNGDRFNSMPARKLSQSFNLDISGATLSSSKHNMLCAIGSIISTHTPYKRSYDSHFKAFICAALNANKLVPWLGLIFQCRHLINMHYQPWSYVAKTGFQDSLRSLDALTGCKFDLPVDLAVQQFQNIKDAFT